MCSHGIFLGVDLIGDAASVKGQQSTCRLLQNKKGAQPVRGAPFSISRYNIERRGDCREQDIVSSGSDPQILLTRQVFKSQHAPVAATDLSLCRNKIEVRMVTDPETRKAIAQRAIDRAAERSAPMDKDPAFVALLDEWVRGDIEFKEMRERYRDILALQAAERRGRWKSRIEGPRSVSSDEPTEE